MSGIGTRATGPRRAAVVVCCGLLGLFAALSYSAVLTKSATYDEPMHALAGWLKLHRGDYRLDYESLPLPARWSALANPADAIRFDATDPNWAQAPNDTYRGFTLVTDTLYRTAGNDGAAFVNRARLMMTMIGIALGALVITWAWTLGGAPAAVVAATLFCLDPNLLGHASLVTTDLAVTLAMTGAILAIWRLGQRLTVLNSLLLCLALAAGINTKFSALLLWPVLVVLLSVRVLHPSPWVVLTRSLGGRRARLAAACVVVLVAAGFSVLGTWAAHGFRFRPSPDPSVQLGTQSYRYELILSRYRREHPESGGMPAEPAGTLEELVMALDRSIAEAVTAVRSLSDSGLPRSLLEDLERKLHHGRAVRAGAAARRAASPDGVADSELLAAVRKAEYQLAFLRYLAAQPRQPSEPLFVVGELLLQHRLMPAAWTAGLMVQFSRSSVLNSYLLGHVRHGGTWEFFPVAMAVKMPVATVLALLGAAAAALALLRSRRPRWRQWTWPAACVLVPPIFFLAVAMSSDFNLGVRHIFPMYPFMYVGAAWAIGAALGRLGRPACVAAGILAIMLAGETFVAWPNYIAFFNVAAGGSRGGFRLLGDSNLDWGQDLPALAHWQRRHPDQPLALAYFGTVDPAFYGIRYDPLPPWPPPQDFAATHVLAVSATHLQGIFDVRYAGYRQLAAPAESLGGTIYLFDAAVRPGLIRP